MKVTVKGSVKVGRWTYPAEQDESGTIRNEKRDGTGGWVKADAAAFVADEPTQTATADYHAAKDVYFGIYSDFSVHGSDALRVGDLTEKRALEITRYLVKTGLVVRGKDENGQPFWQCAKTYDELSPAEAADLFAQTVPADLVVPVTAIRADKPVNNTVAKPGKSTWEVGTPCPKGAHVLTEELIYVMPSGRTQCRDCRRGYPSNL